MSFVPVTGGHALTMRNHQKVAQPIGPRIHASAEIVIVGNGIAGLTAAVEARQSAPDKTILLLTEQCHPTINTPALKQCLSGKIKREQLLAYPAGMEQSRGLKIVQARVEEIDARERRVLLAGGGNVQYGSLLLATGSVANGLPAELPGREFDGVLILHRLRDYQDLRRRLREVREVVVVGSGSHAAETALSLLEAGKKVSWLLRGQTCLGRQLNTTASELVLRYLQQLGARVYRETELQAIIGSVGAVSGVLTNHNEVLPCQLVLACTGTKPAIELATCCNLPLIHEEGRGILVDDRLRTSVPHILAAGDSAACRDPQTGIYYSQGQWFASVVQGRAAAATLTSQFPLCLSEALGVSWHATRLGNLSILAVGRLAATDTTDVTVLVQGDRRGYRRVAISGDRLVAYLAVGSAQPDGLAIKRLVDEGLPVLFARDALLKGTFQARDYFARLHAAHLYPMAVTQRSGFSETSQFSPAVGTPVTPPYHPDLLASASLSRRRPQTEPLRKLASARPAARRSAYISGELESGGSAPGAPNRPLPASPTTPILPLLVSLPSSQHPVRSRSLWSYERERGQSLCES